MKIRPTSRFLRNEKGSLSVEACFVLPILAWAISATFVFFDAFKTLNLSQKATYAIADMISREEVALDDDYITALFETYDFLAGTAGENTLRISVVEMVTDPDTDTETLELVWSEGMNTPHYITVAAIQDRIPTLAVGEQLIVVESEHEWIPAFNFGLASYKFYEAALARPRFAPKICWETTEGCLTAPSSGGV